MSFTYARENKIYQKKIFYLPFANLLSNPIASRLRLPNIFLSPICESASSDFLKATESEQDEDS